MHNHFRDKGESLYYFFDTFDKLLECPDCSSCIILKCKSSIICCNHCGYLKDISLGHVTTRWGSNYGVCYDHKLWLRTPCCGRELWAFNKEHLHYLFNYITADIRGRTPYINQSVASRLPDWIKSSKNKIQLKKALERLERKMEVIQ